MLTIRQEKASDAAAREILLDVAYGPVRFEKPSHRLRAGRSPERGLSFVAVEDGRVIGSVTLWNVATGNDRPALLLGPLVVDPTHRCRGVGAALMRHALRVAGRRGHGDVLLVGDAAYYSRFGFSPEKTSRLWLPGLTDKSRLLGLELVPGALDGARGTVRVPDQRPRKVPAAISGLAVPAQPRAA